MSSGRPDTAATRIVAPVSRFLAVADVARSVAFYRDVLGFTAREPGSPGAGFEVSRGPARIQLLAGEHAWDSTGASRPRGAAIVFFQTDGVGALREEIAGRGGQPSELEKVNWIKMRMFQVCDPDGHTLWFGQSFAEPDSPGEPGQLLKALPALPLTDVAAGVVHYRDVLGFRVNYQQDGLGVMDRDEITLLLIARTERHGGTATVEFYVRDADALFAELRDRRANVRGEPVSRPWGLRDFTVLDPEGNELIFAQPFE